MANLGSLLISLGVDLSAFNAAMGGLNDRLRQAERDATGAWSGFEALAGRMTNVGQTLSLAVTAPIIGIGAASAHAFGQFESSMNRVSALGEITGKDLDKLKAQAIDLGAKTQFSAKQAADGMAELAAAGFKSTEVMAAMPAVLNLAASGQMDVGRAAEVAANVMGGFGIKAADVGHAVDVMAKAAASGSLGVGDLASTFKYVGPVATAAGISLEEVAAATTLLSNAGIKGEQAGTSLRGAIASLLDPSKEAAGVLQRLGVETTTTDGKMRPFSAIIGELGKQGATTKDIFAIFGRETASAMQALVAAGAPALQKMTTELVNSDGAAAKMAGTLQQGLGGAMERMKGSIETAGIALGESLAPTIITVAGLIEGAANKLAEFGKWFSALPEPVKQTTIVITALGAAIGPVLLVAGQMASAIISIQAALAIAGPAVSGFVTAVGGTVATMAPWVVAIGAVTVSVYKLVDALNAKANAEEMAEKAQKGYTDSITMLESKLRAHGADIRDLKREYDQGIKSQDEYAKALRRLAIDLGNKKKATTDATGATSKATQAEKDMAVQIAKVNAAIKSATTTNQAYTRETTGTAESSGKVAKQSEVLAAMYRILDTEHKKAVESVARYRLGLTETANVVPRMIEINLDLSKSLHTVSDSMDAVKAMGDIYAREMALVFETPAPAAERTGREISASVSGIGDTLGGVVTRSKGLWDRFGVDMSGGLGRATTIWDDWTGSLNRSADTFSRGLSETLWSGDFAFGKEGMKAIRDIGQAFTEDFFNRVTKGAQDLMMGVIADLIGGKGFGGIIDRVKDLGKTIADVFGSTGGAIGETVSGAGGAAGGGGGIPGSSGGGQAAGGAAAGGVMGIANLVTGIVSAVSDVITAIYAIRQEGTLNAVEHNTRYAMMYLGEHGGWDILTNTGKTREFLGYLNNTADAIGRKLDDWMSPIPDLLADVNTRLGYMVSRLDQIGNDAMRVAERDYGGILSEIRDAVREGPRANVTINVSGAASPQATANEIAARLRTQYGFGF
jgi:TP901 family phage tail tape measure protein